MRANVYGAKAASIAFAALAQICLAGAIPALVPWTDPIEHAFTVAAPPDAVYAHLADPANYVGLSPLVVDVRDVSRDDGVTRYRAVERFPVFGNLSYDNVIAVTLVADGHDQPVVLGGHADAEGAARALVGVHDHVVAGFADSGLEVVEQLGVKLEQLGDPPEHASNQGQGLRT